MLGSRVKKNILITGGTGFIGKHLIKSMYRYNNFIYATYRNTPPEDSSDVVYIEIDLSDVVEIHKLFEKYHFDAVVHLAMHMKGSRISDYLQNSVLATKYLIEESEKSHVNTFILASSISVFGYVEGVVDEFSDRVNLDDYATSKYICERMLEDSTIINRLSIRLPRMLGNGMDLSYPWIPAMIGKFIKGDEVTYFNPELLYNNMAHVSTLADFVLMQIESEQNGYRLCTIGASEPLRVLEIVKLIKTGLNSKSVLKEKIDNLPRNTCYLIDIRKACRMGYKPLSVIDTIDLAVKDICMEHGING